MDTETMMGISFLRYPVSRPGWAPGRTAVHELIGNEPLSTGPAATPSAFMRPFADVVWRKHRRSRKTCSSVDRPLRPTWRTNDISRSEHLKFMLHGSGY